jgi:hypothetical protein
MPPSKPGGEEFDLAVPVGVLGVGRLVREQKGVHRDDRRDHVDDALQRIGKDRRGAGDVEGE